MASKGKRITKQRVSYVYIFIFYLKSVRQLLMFISTFMNSFMFCYKLTLDSILKKLLFNF